MSAKHVVRGCYRTGGIYSPLSLGKTRIFLSGTIPGGWGASGIRYSGVQYSGVQYSGVGSVIAGINYTCFSYLTNFTEGAIYSTMHSYTYIPQAVERWTKVRFEVLSHLHTLRKASVAVLCPLSI